MTQAGGLPDAAPMLARIAAPFLGLRALGAGVQDFCEVVIRASPPLWLYGSIALVATLYTALFGLGAAAYRTLYVQR